MTFEEAIPILFEVIPRHGARADIPIAAEDFFTALAAQFDDASNLREHLEEHAPGWYRCLRERPDWIQGPDWPWAGGKPMVFVGSIDAPQGTFHDDARFYVFWSPEVGTTECVIQVA
jgi:hypothetical protein